MIVWSWVLIFEKRILLIKRSKNKPSNASPNHWSFPWWRWEIWETPEQVTIRELKEEIWVNFVVWELIEKQTYFNLWEVEHYIFLWNSFWKIVLQEEECDWYWWFTYEETENLLISDKIRNVIKKLYYRWFI